MKIKTFYQCERPTVVELSFSLTYLDWCKLQELPAWSQVEEELERLQKGYTHLLHRG